MKKERAGKASVLLLVAGAGAIGNPLGIDRRVAIRPAPLARTASSGFPRRR